MNGVHDMGGMQGFGPIHPEKNEPVFHAPWESRVLAMRRVVGAIGKVRPSGFRAELEHIPPAQYLSNSYYENWLAAFIAQLVHSGLVTPEEIERGKPAKGSVQPVIALEAAAAAALPFLIPHAMLKVDAKPRFTIGQRVRARNIHPEGHTRLPRYARGKLGAIEAPRGVQAFPDTNAYGRGEHAQDVYCVRFAARELWGEQAPQRDSVYIDLWDEYLDPA